MREDFTLSSLRLESDDDCGVWTKYWRLMGDEGIIVILWVGKYLLNKPWGEKQGVLPGLAQTI